VFASWKPNQPEITDLIVQHDAESLERIGVRKADVLGVFARFGTDIALRAVRALPDIDAILDEREIDSLLVIHWEMQRPAEEFYHGHRVWELVRCVVTALRGLLHEGGNRRNAGGANREHPRAHSSEYCSFIFIGEGDASGRS
jgi:hypothetical protein